MKKKTELIENDLKKNLPNTKVYNNNNNFFFYFLFIFRHDLFELMFQTNNYNLSDRTKFILLNWKRYGFLRRLYTNV